MKRTFIVMVSLFIGFTLFAQGKSDFTGSLLWKISGNGLNAPSYVLGTYHVYGSQFVDSIPGLRKVMAETRQMVGEIDMKEMPAIQMQLMQAATMPAEESYQNLLSETDYAKLDEGLKGIMGVGLDQMGTMKPGMINSTLAIFMYMKINPSFNPTNFEGIDSYLQQVAHENGHVVKGLETVEDQIYVLFDSEPLKEQVEGLLCGVTHIDYSVEQLAALTEYYHVGDLNSIYRISFENPNDPCMSFTQSSKDGLLKHRNDKWMKQLPGLMKENPSLIAVGALHLAGEEGVLYQLKELGYTVEAVR